jgi:hypothetical protein
MSRVCSTYGEKRGLYRVLVGKLERKEPRGGRKCRWENNNKNYLQEVIWEVMDWIDMAQEGTGGGFL